MNLSANVKITRVMNGVTAGTDDTQTGTGVDMQGYEGVMFVAMFGALTATAVTKLHAEQDTASGFDADPQDLAGTELAIAVADANKCLVLDIYKPRERYVRPLIIRATANAVIDGIIAIQYGAGTVPTTHAASVAGSELHVSPAEGTK